MTHQGTNLFTKELASIRKKAIPVSAGPLICSYQLDQAKHLPLVVEPQIERMHLAAWITDHRGWIAEHLAVHGGILFRGFPITEMGDFEDSALALSREMLEYNYRSTPRTRVGNQIYTSTEYPPSQSIPMHNENSYAHTWPMKIWFYCQEAAEHGGQTPLADSRIVYASIDPEVRESFARKKVMYIRNYGAGVDLPWRTVFQTQSRMEVEAYCRAASIEWQWLGEDRLRTRQVAQAVARHPKGGEWVWFNQAHLFHLSSLEHDVQQSLLETLGEENLPRQTCYGDGSPIESTVLDEVRRAYGAVAVEFEWKQDDLLLLDNMLTAHGRRPFRGSRRILVAMAEPMCADALGQEN